TSKSRPLEFMGNPLQSRTFGGNSGGTETGCERRATSRSRGTAVGSLPDSPACSGRPNTTGRGAKRSARPVAVAWPRLPVAAQSQAVSRVNSLAPGGLRNAGGHSPDAPVAQADQDATGTEALDLHGVALHPTGRAQRGLDLRHRRVGPGIIRDVP